MDCCRLMVGHEPPNVMISPLSTVDLFTRLWRQDAGREARAEYQWCGRAESSRLLPPVPSFVHVSVGVFEGDILTRVP